MTVGMHVAIAIQNKPGMSEHLEFDLVPNKQSDFSSGLMSECTPLARAVHGHKNGETVQYLPPFGAEQSVTILKVEPSQRELPPTADCTDSLGKPMNNIARRESWQIALTTELLYGSIDPDGIEE